MGSMQIQTVVIPLDNFTGADDTMCVFQAPSAAQGGGITILDAKVVNLATSSGTIAMTLALLLYSALGTPALAGTVAAAIGGTTDHFTANLPKAFTISDGKMSAGQWLAVKKTEVTSSFDPTGFIVLHYAFGC